jgi:hypothetical protein
MANYLAALTTTAVSDGSKSIAPSGLVKGDEIEIMAHSAGVWVNIKGGASTVNGANCIRCAQDQRVPIVAADDTLTAIREASTDAEVTVAILSGRP